VCLAMRYLVKFSIFNPKAKFFHPYFRISTLLNDVIDLKSFLLERIFHYLFFPPFP
jgi:hypothetical protein